MPYIEEAAPMYVHALQNPPTVDDLPECANLPGRQEIKRKLQECIQAQIIEANKRQTTLAPIFSILISKANGMHRAIETEYSMPAPLASLLKTFPLCIILTAKRLIIENIGRATETKIDSEESLLNASLYRVGNQDSIPSRIKPITIMQTKIGKTPELLKICQMESPCICFFVFSTSVSFSGLAKTRLISVRKIAPATIQKIVDVKNTAFQDINAIQIGV